MRLKYSDFAFVIIQAILFISYFLDVELHSLQPSFFNLFLGLLFTAIGLVVTLMAILQLSTNLSPFPTPKTNSELIQHGLYKYIRHPIYTGILFLGFGIALYLNSTFKLLLTSLLWILFYFKSVYEEKQLQKKFSQYKDYKKTAGRFFPNKKSFM